MIELGLARISQLIGDHVSPLTWRAIHIAGTNGKGSVAAYLMALCARHGIRVGRFTSPHLIDRWDCITLNQKPVSEQRFLEVENEIKLRNSKSNLNASEFEILTATAFELFNREKLHVGIVECGMGGLRDATNVLKPDQVLVSVITKIGLDHQDFLGSTIAEITREKSGIIKDFDPVVVDGSNLQEVKDVIRQKASETESDFFESNHSILPSSVLSKLEPHQQDNLSLAVTALSVARERQDQLKSQPNLDLDLDSIVKEAHAEWKGRLQLLSIEKVTGRKENVLLDGAHNSQSAEVLRDYVNKHYRTQDASPITWVIGMKSGKDLQGILSILLRKGDQVVTTPFGPVDGMPWVKSATPEELAALIPQLTDKLAPVAQDIPEALQTASKISNGGPLIIAGSLYLVSDVLRLLSR